MTCIAVYRERVKTEGQGEGLMVGGFSLSPSLEKRILARVKRSETRPGESCDEPVEPPIIQDRRVGVDGISMQP